MPPEHALAELRRHSGTQFDPGVVEAFASVTVYRPAAPRAI
jgi:HD-GYP domain-containing protein (c-di-GMP phosphodiesterase class II)